MNHGGAATRGLVLLVGGAPGGRRRQPVRPEAALGLLATLPSEALLGSPIPASVLQLADPADPQLLLAHLQTAASTPGPVLVALVGQLTADRRRKELHLALARTTHDNTRYTALPWAWLGDQLRRRPLGTTTVLADLVADPGAWSVLQQHGPEALTPGLPLFGQVSPPGTSGDGYAPPYTRALVDQLRRAQPGIRPSDVHHLAGHSGLPAGALLLTPETPLPAPAVPGPAAPTLPAPTAAPVAPAPTAAVPMVAVPAPFVPALAWPAPTVAVPAVPAPTPSRPTERHERPATPGTAPAPPVAADVVDPRPGIAGALHTGDLPRAAFLIGDWERQLLRHQGPRAPQLADVAEAQAQLALTTGDLARAAGRLIESARLRMQQLPRQAPELALSVDNAVAIWGRLPRESALQYGAPLLTLCRALPAGGDRLRDVEARLAQLTERTGLLRRAR